MSSVISANLPLPFSVGPKPSFPFKLGEEAQQQQSSTNGIYLVVTGLAISVVRIPA
jgi:hypothetical protein